MKTKSLITTAFMLFFTLTVFAQDDLFKKLADREDVSQVSISKALLSMAHGSASPVKFNGLEIKDIIDKLEQIDIFSTKENEAKQIMRKEVSEKIKNNKAYEVLMRIKDNGSNVTFYGQKSGENFKSMLMFADGNEESVIIHLLGTFTAQDIKTITNQVNL
jgi:hypothetical protein